MADDKLTIIPNPYKCQGECGVDEVCSSVVYLNGYCYKPLNREIAIKLRKPK